jgi:hypothetical protein
MYEIGFSYFGHLLCQNRPEIKDRKSRRIWNPFLLGLNFQSLTWTMRLSSDFSWIPRAFRSFLISIYRPLNIEERHTTT